MPKPDYLPNPVTLTAINRKLTDILENLHIEERRVVDTESHLWDLLRSVEQHVNAAWTAHLRLIAFVRQHQS